MPSYTRHVLKNLFRAQWKSKKACHILGMKSAKPTSRRSSAHPSALIAPRLAGIDPYCYRFHLCKRNLEMSCCGLKCVLSVHNVDTSSTLKRRLSRMTENVPYWHRCNFLRHLSADTRLQKKTHITHRAFTKLFMMKQQKPQRHGLDPYANLWRNSGKATANKLGPVT